MKKIILKKIQEYMHKILLLLFASCTISIFGQSTFNIEFFNDSRYFISKSVLQNKDSTIMVVGNIDSMVGNNQVRAAFLKKLNKKGELLWTKVYSLPDIYGLEFNKIISTSDNNYAILGSIDYGFGVGPTFVDVFFSKIDTSGKMLWHREYGDIGTDEGFEMIEHDNGDFSIFSSYGKEKNLFVYNAYQIIYTDSEGYVIWSKNYYNEDEIEQFPSKFQVTRDHGYILTGTITNVNGSSNTHIINTDLQGNVLWKTTLIPEANSDIIGIMTNTDHFTIFGNINTSTNTNKLFMANYSYDGTLNWMNYINANNLFAFSVSKTNDGNIAWIGLNTDSIGNTNIVFKTDTIGNILWRKILTFNTVYYPSEIIASSDSDLIAIGNTNNTFNSAFYIVKINDASTLSVKPFAEPLPINIIAFPNPCVDILNFLIDENDLPYLYKISITDIQGELIYTINKDALINKQIDLSKLQDGIYEIVFQSEKGYDLKSFIIVKD